MLKPFTIIILSCLSLVSRAQTQSYSSCYGAFMEEGYSHKNLSKMKSGSELLDNLTDEIADYHLNSLNQRLTESWHQVYVSADNASSIELLTYPSAIKRDFTPISNTLNGLSPGGIVNPSLGFKFDQYSMATTKGTPHDSVDELIAKFNAMMDQSSIINSMLSLATALKYYSKGNIVKGTIHFDDFLIVKKAWPPSYKTNVY